MLFICSEKERPSYVGGGTQGTYYWKWNLLSLFTNVVQNPSSLLTAAWNICPTTEVLIL